MVLWIFIQQELMWPDVPAQDTWLDGQDTWLDGQDTWLDGQDTWVDGQDI